MRLILNNSTDPAFNLAAEEYLLNTATEKICMLWRNERAVIVGRNQNTIDEIDQTYAETHGIRVHRRLTGGGAVFHDLGNINFTLIEPEEERHFNNYDWFTADLTGFLAALGVNAQLNDRNDVLIQDRKICGNAQCVQDGKVLHHGCILYDADLTMLAAALRPDPEKLRRRGIASVASRVANIRGYMANELSAEEFLNGFAEYIKQRHSCAAYHFTKKEAARIQLLADRKYASREWNYGASPDWDGKVSPC